MYYLLREEKMGNNKVIKAIFTKYYGIELLADQDDLYFIKYEGSGLDGEQKSEPIRDLNLALRLFDLKLQEIQGN